DVTLDADRTSFGNFDGRAGIEEFRFDAATHLKPTVADVDTTRTHWITSAMDYDQDGRMDVVAYHLYDLGATSSQPYPPYNPYRAAASRATNGRSDAAYLFHGGWGGHLAAPIFLNDIPLVLADFDGDGVTDMVGGTASDLNGNQQTFYQGVSTSH